MNRRTKAIVLIVVATAITCLIVHRCYLVSHGRIINEREFGWQGVARIREYNKSFLPADGYYYALEIVGPRRGIWPRKVFTSFFVDLDSFIARTTEISGTKESIRFELDYVSYICDLATSRYCIWYRDESYDPVKLLEMYRRR